MTTETTETTETNPLEGIPEEVLLARNHATTATVLLDYFEEIDVEFDAEKTALEARAFWDRLARAEYARMVKLGVGRDEFRFQDFSLVSQGHKYVDQLEFSLFRLIAKNHGLYEQEKPYYTARLTRCDMFRILDAVRDLSDIDASILAEFVIQGPKEKRIRYRPTFEQAPQYYVTEEGSVPEYDSSLHWRTLTQRLADIVKENVVITMMPGKSLKFIEGTADGATPVTRTLDGDVPSADDIALTECAIKEVGIQICKLDQLDESEKMDAWFTVENKLTGRNIVFKQQGTGYLVNVAPGIANMVSFTGFHVHAGAFDVSITDVEAT